MSDVPITAAPVRPAEQARAARPTSPLDLLLSVIPAKRSGKGWMAKCPAHDDRDPSLSIREGEDGRALLHCFAGCPYQAILDKVGLSGRDLFVPANNAYPYRDRLGRVVRRRVRRSGKQFTWQTPSEGGGWRNGGASNVERTLFRANEIAAADRDAPLYLVEGEKDVERLRENGFIATTSGDANSWLSQFAEQFSGRDVVILPDNDAPGEKYAEDAARDILPLARSLRIVRLPGLPPKGDVSDFLDNGGSVEQLDRIVAETAPEELISPLEEKRESKRVGWQLASLRQLLNEPPEKVRWVVEGLIPAGGMSLLAGRPKVGKSTLTRQLAASVASGADFLGRPTTRGTVVYLALEEKRSEVADHFRRLGVDEETAILVHVGAPPIGHPADLLRSLIADHLPALVIIDPLQQFLRARDVSDYSEIVPTFARLNTLARDSGAALVLTHHTNKSDSGDEDSFLGSTAIFGGVDTGLIIRRPGGGEVRTIRSRQRYGAEIAETAMRFNEATGYLELAGLFAAVRSEDDVARIVKIVGDDELTDPEIRERAGINTARVPAALKRAMRDDYLKRTGTGKRGSPFRYSRK